MLKISEEYLQFAWKFGLFNKTNLRYQDESLEIIDPGEHNNSSGPDFFNARLKIGDTTWEIGRASCRERVYPRV